MSKWLEKRIEELGQMAGESIVRWNGVEMAFRGHAPAGQPQFCIPDVPCLQLMVVHIELTSGIRALGTYQDDDEYGIYSWLPKEPLRQYGKGLFRTRPLDELPTGVIGPVNVRQNTRGNVDEVDFVVANQPIIFVAGESEETMDGTLFFVRGDESLLVFTTRSDIARLNWRDGDDQSTSP